MSNIATTERDTYEEMWGITAYSIRSFGEDYTYIFAEHAKPGSTVLDAGCGSGKGALALAALGYKVTMCDLTGAGLVPDAHILPFFQATLWEPLVKRYNLGGAYDYVYCTDVLEHLPTVFVALAITRMLDVTKKGLFISAALGPDNMGVWVGRPLHQTVYPFPWWRDLLGELGTVIDARDLMHTGIYYVEPKR